MPTLNVRSFLILFLPFAVLFSIRVLSAIHSQSLTSDEPFEITNGYYYWMKGDVSTPNNHPPLGMALQCLPLFAMHLETGTSEGDRIDRSHSFFFVWNRDRVGVITFWTRSVSWVLGLAVGFILWWITRTRPLVCLGTMFFWALDPLLSTFSGLAKTEITPCLFFLMAVLAFGRAQEKPSMGSAMTAGMMTALAVGSKLYCLVLLPIFIVLESLHPLKKEKLLYITQVKGEARRRWITGVGSFFLATFLIFLPETLLDKAHHQPFYYFFSKIIQNWIYSQNHFPVFFMGTAGSESHWYYLPAAFLLKEPLVFLFFLFLSAGLALRGKIQIPAWLWVPPLFFFVAVLPTLNLGVRYLLPAYPFFFLLAGEGLAWVCANKIGNLSPSFPKVLVAILLVWQAVSVFGFPGTSLGYFNETIPVEKRIHYLGDSNLDWGQDLKRVARFAQRKGWGKVHLAYLGGIDPKVYGLDWVPWDEDDLKGPRPGGVYLVNASFLQLGPLAYPSVKPIAESWLKDRDPDGRIGDAWYYFQIPGQESPNPKAKLLVSVPFLEYRGYTPFYSITR